MGLAPGAARGHAPPMTPPERPPIAFDSISPQSSLVTRACTWLLEELARPDDTPVQERVKELALALVDAQPAMGALFSLGTRLLAVADKANKDEAPPAESVARVVEGLKAWRADFAAASEAVTRAAVEIFPASGWVATTTRSSLVERTLLLAKRLHVPVRVLLAESRPMNEGQGLARVLAEEGIPTWYAVDGGLSLLLPRAEAFLVGADAVRERTFVTKAGTYALLLVARELNLPAYVLAQRAKFVPDRCTRLTLPRRPPDEVWEAAPQGVVVVNAPFEEVPLALVRGVLTETGFLGPREIMDAAGVAPIAAELRTGDGPQREPATA